MSEKNKKVKLGTGKFHAKINSVKVEIEKAPLIYRNKFLEEYKKCKKEDFSEAQIIFSFIFLQIYFECFFHQKLRKLVELEFKHSNPEIWKKWTDEEEGIEGKYIQDKEKGGKLTEFVNFFDIQNQKEVLELKDLVEDNLQDITDIRNNLVHGHKIAEGKDFDGEEYKTETKKFLTEQSLKESIDKVNTGGDAWNSILDKLSSSFKSLNVERVDDFKFEKLDLNYD